MKKVKHSKFKNTGFLFELIVRQITSELLANNTPVAEKILKKFFAPKKELAKELRLYQYLINQKYNSESKAEKFIDTICEARKRLDESKITKEKYNLIKEIKESYNIDEFVKSPISNYKLLASIYKLFETRINSDVDYEPAHVMESRFTITENIIQSTIPNKEVKIDNVLEEYKKQDEDTRLMTYKLLVEKFNDKYKSLSKPQKTILKEYINNVNNSNGFNDFVKHRIDEITSTLKSKKITDKVTKIKLNEVVKHLDKIKKTKNFKENHLSALMMSYELIDEITTVTK